MWVEDNDFFSLDVCSNEKMEAKINKWALVKDLTKQVQTKIVEQKRSLPSCGLPKGNFLKNEDYDKKNKANWLGEELSDIFDVCINNSNNFLTAFPNIELTKKEDSKMKEKLRKNKKQSKFK